MRERGLEPDMAVGHSVGEFAALAAAGSLEIWNRNRVSSASEGSRWRRLRDSGRARWLPGSASPTRAVATHCSRIVGVSPANYHCPGQIVVSGEHDAVEECCAEAAEPQHPTGRDAEGLGCVPQPARREKPYTPCARRSIRVRFTEPLSPFMSAVAAKIEPAPRVSALLVDQAHRGQSASRRRRRAHPLGRDDVRRGRSGNVLSGLVKRIDRGVKTMSVNSLESLERAQEALAR